MLVLASAWPTTGESERQKTSTALSVVLAPQAPTLSFKESQAVMQKLSDGERSRLYAAQRARTTEITFDADSRLTAAEQAKKMGFAKVYWLRSGMPEWRAKNLPVRKQG